MAFWWVNFLFAFCRGFNGSWWTDEELQWRDTAGNLVTWDFTNNQTTGDILIDDGEDDYDHDDHDDHDDHGAICSEVQAFSLGVDFQCLCLTTS